MKHNTLLNLVAVSTLLLGSPAQAARTRRGLNDPIQRAYFLFWAALGTLKRAADNLA